MKAAVYFTVASLLICFTACNTNPAATNNAEGAAAINADTLAAKIAFFSSDSFQGRRPFTLGETRAVDYIQSQFKSLGLAPGNGDSYVQDVPMVEIKPAVPPVLKMKSAKGEVAFQNLTDYVIWTKQTDTPVVINNADVVFAGFGVVAPEKNWNDYAGLDVKGKIVMVMVNDPGFTVGDTSLFKGKEMTYYGRWTYKYEEAARQGAKGCLIIHNTAAASYPFNVVQNSNGGTKLHLDTRNSKIYNCPLLGWVSADAAKKILEASGKDTTLYTKANVRGFKGEALSVKISANIQVNAVFNTSHNVIAKITGTKYPDEYIIYTAHWDHFGIGKPDEKGDSIYNGALDNASGVISIIEIAKAFQSLKEKPERTIVFLAVTAEEQGLLGSEYYGKNPIYPLAKTVANINIDEINIIGKTKDLGISGGKGQSELEDMLEAELKKQNRYIAPELHPEAGHYFRSDHFNFAKVGVPSITISAGTDHVEKGKEYGRQREDEYTEKYYHRPADEYNANTWNLGGAVEDLQLLFALGKDLAYSQQWPKWNNGSEFKAIREK
ncbi:MAG: M28 family metallopeptidase [Chitinophagaceae bacterium]